MTKKFSPPPIIREKAYEQSSVFIPENLLKEARRQKSILAGRVPSVCVLDPDTETVTVYTADNPEYQLTADDEFSLQEYLGDLRVPIRRFFE